MNKLIVYLCGPINGCSDSEAKDWREAAKRDHPEHDYIDPMRNDYRGREGEPGVDKLIVEGDKQDVMDSDIILVNYDKPSVGTAMEVLFAWEAGKIIIVVAKDGTAISPWLTYHADAVVPTFARAFEYIADVSKAAQDAAPLKDLDKFFDAMDASFERIFGKGQKFWR